MSGERRRPLIAANWKMNLLKADAAEYCRDLRRGLAAATTAGEVNARVVIFPSFPLIPVVARELVDSEVEVGGQDLHPEERGAHTGDVSASQLADAGCAWVLCGHSERRQNHGESDEWVGLKVAAAARHRQLTPLICVGETATERKEGRTFEVLERQLLAALAGGPGPFALAYEPVWAIGTGRTPTHDQIVEVHEALLEVAERFGGSGRVLYGGSVKPENAAELMALPGVGGALVGGASLRAKDFLPIVYAAA